MDATRNAVGRFMWVLRRRWRIWRTTVVRQLFLFGWRRSHGPRTDRGRSSRTGRGASSTVPVVMCVWRRPHRLSTTLSFLARQSHDALTFCIWNNNADARELVDAAVADVSGFDVTVVHSARNAGGFGRFYFARRLASEFPWVVFLDDDQVTGEDCIAALVDEFRPQTVHAARAFRFSGIRRFFDRVEARPGERVKYCGTGGMIADTRVFREHGLFRCPRRYWFVEDLWLSYYADAVLGWPLFKSITSASAAPADRRSSRPGSTEIIGEPDAFDQSQLLKPTKDRLFRYLVRRGWDPAGDLDPGLH